MVIHICVHVCTGMQGVHKSVDVCTLMLMSDPEDIRSRSFCSPWLVWLSWLESHPHIPKVWLESNQRTYRGSRVDLWSGWV